MELCRVLFNFCKQGERAKFNSLFVILEGRYSRAHSCSYSGICLSDTGVAVHLTGGLKGIIRWPPQTSLHLKHSETSSGYDFKRLDKIMPCWNLSLWAAAVIVFPIRWFLRSHLCPGHLRGNWHPAGTALYSRYSTPGTAIQVLQYRYSLSGTGNPGTIRQVLQYRYYTPGTAVHVFYSRYYTTGMIFQVLYWRYYATGTILQVLYSRYYTAGTILQVLYYRYYTTGTTLQVLYSRKYTPGTILQILYSRYYTTGRTLHYSACFVQWLHIQYDVLQNTEPWNVLPGSESCRYCTVLYCTVNTILQVRPSIHWWLVEPEKVR